MPQTPSFRLPSLPFGALRGRRIRTALALALVLAGPVLAVATGVALSGATDPGIDTLRPLLLADFVYVLVVLGLVAQRVATTIAARRRQSAGSRLHMRLMGVFAVIALAPTILVAVFATLTLNFGLEGWFSERVRNVVGNSLAAAQAYEAEHRHNLSTDAEELARFLNERKERFPLISPGQLRELLNRGQLQMQRDCPRPMSSTARARCARAASAAICSTTSRPAPGQIARARQGETVIIEDPRNFEFRALVALPAFADRYLYVTRDVDGDIIRLLDETRETVQLYQQLERDRGRLLFEFALIYLGFAGIVILAAIWLGLWFAERLSRPVGKLAEAAQRVGAGDLDTRVAEQDGDDEIATLGRVFNRMTQQVRGQRDALIEANRETERRRRLFDSILSSVTAGVIGLDAQGRIEMINAAAAEILDLGTVRPGRMELAEAVPAFQPVFARLDFAIGSVAQEEVRMAREDGGEAVLLVRMATRAGVDGKVEGYVITFDDVSDLVAAQRMAAWGDVARRIAHEIKRPSSASSRAPDRSRSAGPRYATLTPIQLSAERLRRKFGPKVDEADRKTLESYAEVIIRQTNDLRRIVDEFSKFARMPGPSVRQAHRPDRGDPRRGAAASERPPRHPLHAEVPEGPVEASIDT